MIFINKEVLAKSGPPVPLKQHINECLEVFESLQKAFQRLPVKDSEQFWKLVRLSIIFHDLGKSHSEFQKMLEGKRSVWYQQRHELFSVPFIDSLNINKEDILILKLVVAGHHKDFNFLFDHIEHFYKTGEDQNVFGEDGKLEWKEETEKLSITFIKQFLLDFGISVDLSSLSIPKLLVKDYSIKPINSFEPDFQKILLTAGALKQCDHSASAGILKVNILEDKHFNFLYQTNWQPYDHQQKASQAIGNIVLTAPTGSGKTEASLMWLHHQLSKTGQGRTFYILPFTASINAMFERLDKKMEGNNEIAGMIHGKLSEYIESRFGEENYSIRNEKLKSELRENFRSLIPPLKVATPFQLLKYIFGLKGFEKGIFEMSGGYFIFDEIHAYDPEVTAQIKVLIEFATKYLNVTVCLMTATLPTFLKKELTYALNNYTEIKANNELYQTFIRHRVKVADGFLSDNISEIQKRLNKGEKVLVVCNTVKQAQYLYNNLNSSNKVLLHGAFNGLDRNKKESELASENVKLLVGTQAIEVSLDIDYDVIFTEPAPLDALLQRFGRVNRHRVNGQYRQPCDCIVYSERNDADKYIYQNEKVIENTIVALRNIEFKHCGIMHEDELQDYIDSVYPDWSTKDKEDFNRVYIHLKDEVEKNLSPFIYDSHREEDFEKQFDGIKVLPKILQNEYIHYLELNQFIKAESLKVSISRNRFVALISKENIQYNKTVIQLLKNEKVKELSYFIINKKYDDELGLQIDVDENSSNFTNFI